MNLVYCDKIADDIRNTFLKYDPNNIVDFVGPAEMDLHPTEGYFQSTKKTIEVLDMNQKKYKITIEESI